MTAKRLFTVLVAVAATAIATPAATAATPEQQWPIDGPGVQTALQIANQTWGVPICPGSGGFTIRFGALAHGTVGMARYTDSQDPFEMRNCSITLSTGTDWYWEKLCSVIVHEVGHLTGRGHEEDEHDVMAAMYREPAAACMVPNPQAAPIKAKMMKPKKRATARKAGSAQRRKVRRRA